MIILDNTVLTSFTHIDRLDLPYKLFRDVHIPESVYYEGKKSKRVERIKKSIGEGTTISYNSGSQFFQIFIVFLNAEFYLL
jgi:predicted nucleic acid-binding protein